MQTLMRTMAIIGLGLTGALIHSWVHPALTLRAPEPDQGQPLVPVQPNVDPDKPSPDPQPQNNTAPGQSDTGANQGGTNPPVQPNGQTPAQGTPPAQPDAPRVFDVRTFGTFIDFEQTRYLLQFVDSGQVTFIDARHDQAAYEAGHIPGAIRLSADMFDNADAKAEEFINFYDPSARYVIYCSGGDCDESENTRNRLYDRGYTVSHIYKNGWDEWVTKPGVPVTTGDQP